MRLRYFAPRFALALLPLVLLSPAYTQPSPTAAQLDPLIVTAQKRGQAIDEVPLSITSYTGAALQELGVTRYQDLAPLVPGLFVSVQSPSLPSINVRGIGSDSTDPREEPRISIFQDGVAISRAAGSFTELFDLERIEVLKGPQGTLFGRNAGAGALSLISRKPEPARSAALTLGTGSYDRRHMSGHVNTPVGGDRLLGRVAFTSERRHGFTENLAGGSALNSRETIAVRPALRWLPHSGTTVDLIVNVQRDTPTGIGFKSGIVPTSRGDTDPFTAAELNRASHLGLDRTVWGATLALTHPLSDMWTLNTLSSWRAFDSHEEFDGDGSPLYLLETNDDNRGHQLSQEVRFNFDDRTRWAGFIGVAAFRERAEQRIDLRTDERSAWPFLSGAFREGLIAAGVPTPLALAAVPMMSPFSPQTNLPPGFSTFALVPTLAPLATLAGAPLKPLHAERSSNRAALDAADVFADATWRVTKRLELTAGARISFEHQTSGYDAPPAAQPSTLGFLLDAAPNFAFAPTPGELTAKDTSHGWAGRVIARYVFSSEFNGYASLSRGRRPVSVIVTSTGVTRGDEESVTNFEIGWKGRAAQGRVAWSTAVYEYRYQHFQTFVQDPTNLARFIVADAGSATGRGAEAVVNAALSPSVHVFATYGYTTATFDDRADSGMAQRFAGSTFRLTPRHTAAVGFTAERTFSKLGTFSVSPRWEYKSAHFFEDDNRLLGGTLRQPGYAIGHLRARWISLDRSWEATAYAENLFDRNYLVDAGNIGGSFGLPTFVRAAPRLFGVDVTRRF